MGHPLISCGRLPWPAAEHHVQRAAARHWASLGRSVAAGVSASSPAGAPRSVSNQLSNNRHRYQWTPEDVHGRREQVTQGKSGGGPIARWLRDEEASTVAATRALTTYGLPPIRSISVLLLRPCRSANSRSCSRSISSGRTCNASSASCGKPRRRRVSTSHCLLYATGTTVPVARLDALVHGT